jgi:hypothetical protein
LDKVIWIGCFLLILFGVVFSAAICGDLNFRESLKYVLEVGSFIATITAAVVAIVTLTAWRQQFMFSNIHEALARLASASIGLQAARKYVRNVGYQQINDLAGDARVEMSDLDDEAKEASIAWYKALSEYNAAFEEVSVLVDDPDIESLTAANQDVSSFPLQAILKVINLASSHESSARRDALTELNQVDLDLKKLVNNVKDLIRAIRSRQLTH